MATFLLYVSSTNLGYKNANREDLAVSTMDFKKLNKSNNFKANDFDDILS